VQLYAYADPFQLSSRAKGQVDLLLTVAAEAKWHMEDEVKHQTCSLKDATNRLASLTKGFDTGCKKQYLAKI
jgi:hypothetical protein